jgi:hypothetical protein
MEWNGQECGSLEGLNTGQGIRGLTEYFVGHTECLPRVSV